MLSEFMKTELEFMLTECDDGNLLSLSTTITNGLLKNKINSREGAINAIITYSTDPLDILKRKTLTREILFAYAHKRNLPLTLPATKIDLVNKILEHWTKSTLQPEQQNVQKVESAETTPKITQMAKEFTEWFYQMMNKPETISTQHFFNDASIKINIISNGEHNSEIIENDPLRVVQLLHLTKMNYQLYFNPNLSENGISGKINQHGLVLIFACGTLHQVTNMCVEGIFEQMFGLARDPLCENNWKIKYTELNLKKGPSLGQPSLNASELTFSVN